MLPTQWSHVKTFEFVCYYLYYLKSIFLFCFVFVRKILMFLPFSLSFLALNEMSFNGNIYQWKAQTFLKQNNELLGDKGEEK